MREIRVLKEFSDGSRLRYDVSPAFGPVSSRDNCLYTSLQQLDPKTWLIFETSAPVDFPENPDFVRSEIIFRVVEFKQLEDNENATQITVCDLIDPKGKLPNFAINKIAGKKAHVWVKFIEKLSQVLEQTS